ncbi:protein ACTIVITY OF BC1 COMPLEX KINASE 1, chloroplastic-like [Telopea speciosissima]|uniref:protein ACTIVITY OF BC1 COMPLEX KINASE 1, chloroplastic-like n=1 Tax=Telopea speciosissima TaxID=54955 RepID=UPI001CC4673A|nr:protein ACTIVITY OF BC1 COMPLEX KINASE 1, chloroplastic-like [Telopea speciosissima]
MEFVCQLQLSCLPNSSDIVMGYFPTSPRSVPQLVKHRRKHGYVNKGFLYSTYSTIQITNKQVSTTLSPALQQQQILASASTSLTSLRADDESNVSSATTRSSLLGKSSSAMEQLDFERGVCVPFRKYTPETVKNKVLESRGAILSLLGRGVEIVWNLGFYWSTLMYDCFIGRDKEVVPYRARQLRNLLCDLGPSFIKAGQVLANRPDIIREDYMNELCILQDDVPPFPNQVAFAIIEEELGRPLEDVFSKISSKTIAAASLGQVYRATLRDTGEDVAIKVDNAGVSDENIGSPPNIVAFRLRDHASNNTQSGDIDLLILFIRDGFIWIVILKFIIMIFILIFLFKILVSNIKIPIGALFDKMAKSLTLEALLLTIPFGCCTQDALIFAVLKMTRRIDSCFREVRRVLKRLLDT